MKKFLAVLCLTSLFVGSTQLMAAPRCSEVELTITALELRIEMYQERLQTAAPGQKPALVKKIVELSNKLRAAEEQLESCE